MSRGWRWLLVAGVLPLAISSCVVRNLVTGPRLTGTCSGACDHYVACKPHHTQDDRTRCQRECPQAFADPESLVMFESLSCRDTVEYVDGTPSPPATSSR